MLVMMGVALYTSRVVLQELGVEDYGVFNVVGGIVAFGAFMNASLVPTTQRFLNVEMGNGDAVSLNSTFCQAMNAHWVMALITFILLQTIGLWFLLNKLVIPAGQMPQAIWVFECSILTFIMGIVSAPYNAAIIANERMGVFAGLSIVEAILKLGIALSLAIWADGRLKIYAILLLFVSLIMRSLYNRYCIRHFKECKYHFKLDWKLIKSMLKFSGWMTFGSFSEILANQGVNMLINIFFGPALNAARALAIQVQTAVSQFSNNFMVSVNPQIVKQYSTGDKSSAYRLVFQSSKISFFLMLLLVVPLECRMPQILSIWLKNVPPGTSIFAQLILLEYLIRATYTPIAQINSASGNIRGYQIAISSLYLILFALSWLAFANGLPAWTTFAIGVLLSMVGLGVRLAILSKVNHFPVRHYIREVSFPSFVVIVVSVLIAFTVNIGFTSSFWGTICSCTISLVTTAGTVWMIGLSVAERTSVRIQAKKVLNKFNNR